MDDQPTLDFVALGGTGEIGMNLNLYRTEDRWLMVDAGVTFERGPGSMQVLYADPTFIETQRDRLDGLVITHAHQDHLGAVADLWPRLRCPVYATPFAAAMLEGPLAEARLTSQVPIRLLASSARFNVGPFELQRIPLTHSTVEMGALVIRTAAAKVLHTGDWKLDPDPLVGDATDEPTLKKLADEGIDVVVSDSTNADVPGWTASEGTLPESLRALLKDRKGRIAIPFFSTNVARIATFGRIAAEFERDLVLAGRSLERTVGAAKKAGYLEDLPPLVPGRVFGYLPPSHVLMLCTGSQGEPGAGLTRIAADDHPFVYLEGGDTVVISARVIPGNEAVIEEIHRSLRARGIEVITADDALVHVSGHPCQDELRTLYEWVRPACVLPVHGTPAKLDAHADLVEAMGIKALRLRNGELTRLGPEPTRALGTVHTGRVVRPELQRSSAPRNGARRGRMRS